MGGEGETNHCKATHPFDIEISFDYMDGAVLWSFVTASRRPVTARIGTGAKCAGKFVANNKQLSR